MGGELKHKERTKKTKETSSNQTDHSNINKN